MTATVSTIDVATLRDRLERGEPVTVLDVRPAAERAEWAIPGSRHVDAYDALRAGNPDALADVDLPAGVPVVRSARRARPACWPRSSCRRVASGYSPWPAA